MALHNVDFTDESERQLRAMNPRDQALVKGVLERLENVKIRNNRKYDLCFHQGEYGGATVWGFEDGSVFVGFVETPDGKIVVHQLALRSLFRPGLRHRW